MLPALPWAASSKNLSKLGKAALTVTWGHGSKCLSIGSLPREALHPEKSRARSRRASSPCTWLCGPRCRHVCIVVRGPGRQQAMVSQVHTGPGGMWRTDFPTNPGGLDWYAIPAGLPKVGLGHPVLGFSGPPAAWPPSRVPAQDDNAVRSRMLMGCRPWGRHRAGLARPHLTGRGFPLRRAGVPAKEGRRPRVGHDAPEGRGVFSFPARGLLERPAACGVRLCPLTLHPAGGSSSLTC